MSAITTKQISQLQTICSGKFKNREERLETLSEMVGYHLESVNDLSQLQANELIYFFNTGKPMDHSSWAFFDKRNSQHKTILSLCHQLGWVQEDNPEFVDLHSLGGFLKSNRSPVKSPLKDMTAAECSKIIFALQKILNSKFLK